jgi:hypothetical protein
MRFVLLLLLGLLLVGCETAIGDSCSASTYSTDCPDGSVCDISLPGGYCTKTPCFDDEDCPGAAVCVHFDNGETYCMAPCNESSDCRKRYECVLLTLEDGYCGPELEEE